MRVWRALADVPADLGPTVVTIGNYDGVHRGHRHVIERAREVAAELAPRVSGKGAAVPVVAVTFDPHPFAVLRPEHAPVLLTTIDQRADLLHEAGVDDLLVMPFSREVAGWTPREFVDRILVGTLHAAAVVVGANFRFGNRAAGDVATLRTAGAEAGFEAVGVDLEGGPQTWSSTYIRTCLAAGDVEGANEALGRLFTVRGVVVEGDHRGHELGYPTANVPTEGIAAPADGVYAGWLRRLDQTEGEAAEPMPAAISVGTNPTFDGTERRVESYVLDRDDLELYDVEVEVAFVQRLRGMERFDSVDELLEQIAEDVAGAHKALGVPEP
ncbi:MAG: bifunctional riboflavin kinase/FAD synthetase [Nocardioidaceae bacterium]